MKVRHQIFELPAQEEDMNKVLSASNHDVKNVSFSSVVVDGALKHFTLVVWHDEEYGDHQV